MQEALNKQINAEFYSAWLYLSMSAWFAEQGLPGFAGWMQAQFREEQDHGLKIIHYMHERGGNVELKSIGAVPTTWKSPADVFAQTLAHEQTVTGCFKSIMDLADSSKIPA